MTQRGPEVGTYSHGLFDVWLALSVGELPLAQRHYVERWRRNLGSVALDRLWMVQHQVAELNPTKTLMLELSDAGEQVFLRSRGCLIQRAPRHSRWYHSRLLDSVTWRLLEG